MAGKPSESLITRNQTNMRRVFTLAVMTTAVGFFCGSLAGFGQQPQPQTQPGPPVQTGRGGGRNANNEAVVGAFRTNCAGCHGGKQVPNAPDLAALRQMSPEKILPGDDNGRHAGHGAEPDGPTKDIHRGVADRPPADGGRYHVRCRDEEPLHVEPTVERSPGGAFVEWMEPDDWQHAVAIVQCREALSRAGFALEGFMGLWCPGRNLHV